MRFCVEIDGLLKNLGRTKTLPSRSLFCDIAKMTDNLNSQKGKDFYQNIFISQCGTLPILLWQKKNIPGFCSLPLCCTSEVANVRHWGARHRAFQYYIHHVCTLHACIRLFCKYFAWFHHFSKKTK